MARSFASGDYISFGTGLSVSGTSDVTIAMWVKTTATAASTLLCQRDASGSGNLGQHWLWVNYGTTGKVAWNIYGTDAAFQWGADWNGLISSASVNDGNWHHVAVTRVGTAGEVFVDGASSGTASGTARSLAGAIQVYAGKNLRDASPNDFPFVGSQAELGVWTAGLSAGEIAGLAAGVRPSAVRPASLLDCVPLVGRNSPETGLRVASGTLTGTSQTDHPRVYLPGKRSRAVFVPAAGGGGGNRRRRVLITAGAN